MTSKLFIVFCFAILGFWTTQSQNEIFQQKVEHLQVINSESDFDKVSEYYSEIHQATFKQPFFWPKSSLELFEKAEQWANKNGNSTQQLLAEFYLLRYYDNNLKDNQIIERAKALLKVEKFHDMPESVFTLQALYDSYERKGFYNQQLQILNELIAENKKFNFPVRPENFQSRYELGKIYFELEQFNKARENFKIQTELYKKQDDVVRTSSMLNNIGLTFEKQKKIDSAKYYYNSALNHINFNNTTDSYYTPIYIKHFKNVIKSNIASLNIQNNNFEGAEEIFKNELASSKFAKEPPITGQAYLNLAEFYNKTNDLDLFKKYLDSSQIHFKTYQNTDLRVRYLTLKSEYFIKQNSVDSALVYMEKLLTLKDSIAKAQSEISFSEATTEFDFDEIKKSLAQSREVLKEKKRSNRILSISTLIFSLALLVIGFLLYKTRKSNKLIANQKIELERGVREKEILLDEMHHRVKNNLQVISGILELQSQKSFKKNPSELLRDSINYLQSISLVHKFLYQKNTIGTIDMYHYFDSLSGLVISTFPSKKINIQYHVDNLKLDTTNATTLGLILCELMTNSVKHAFENQGKIEISLSKKNEIYHFKYQDNGVGFMTEDITSKFNTGMNLVMMLSDDLDAEVRFLNTAGFGMEFNFKINPNEIE